MKRITDKERLDWLGREGHSVFISQAWDWSIGGQLSRYPTIRKAIDAAIRQRRGGKR